MYFMKKVFFYFVLLMLFKFYILGEYKVLVVVGSFVILFEYKVG